LLADSTVGNIRISGIYDTRDVNRLVNNLPKVLPIYLTRNDNGSTVINRILPSSDKG